MHWISLSQNSWRFPTGDGFGIIFRILQEAFRQTVHSVQVLKKYTGSWFCEIFWNLLWLFWFDLWFLNCWLQFDFGQFSSLEIIFWVKIMPWMSILAEKFTLSIFIPPFINIWIDLARLARPKRWVLLVCQKNYWLDLRRHHVS